MAQKTKITDKNLYDLLEVLPSATEQELKQAYRKKALKCHPDKNPDNPKAVALFQELSEVFKILTDEKARAAYDRTLKAKELAKERVKELDSKRRKLKEDLERREQAAREEDKARAEAKKKYSTSQANLSEEESLQREVERLRKEGSRALQEEQELIRQQILKEQEGKFSFLSNAEAKPKNDNASDVPRIKIKWAKKGTTTTPPSYDDLMKTYSQFGKVATLVVGKKCAIVEFEEQSDADKAFESESKSKSQFSLEWISKATNTSTPVITSEAENSGATTTHKKPVVPQATIIQGLATNTNFADFEAMILGKLSAAAAAQKHEKTPVASSDPSSSR